MAGFKYQKEKIIGEIPTLGRGTSPLVFILYINIIIF
jgi:hypothetical protein